MLSADDSAPRRVADRLGMGKAEARVLMDTAAQHPHLWTLFNEEVPPSEKRKLLGSACRLSVEAWEAWNVYPSGLTAYLGSLDETEKPALNGHDPTGARSSSRPAHGRDRSHAERCEARREGVVERGRGCRGEEATGGMLNLGWARRLIDRLQLKPTEGNDDNDKHGRRLH